MPEEEKTIKEPSSFIVQEKTILKIESIVNIGKEEIEKYYKNKNENKRKRRIEYTEKELKDYFDVNDENEIKVLKDFINKVQVEFYSDIFNRLVKVKLILKEE